MFHYIHFNNKIRIVARACNPRIEELTDLQNWMSKFISVKKMLTHKIGKKLQNCLSLQTLPCPPPHLSQSDSLFFFYYYGCMSIHKYLNKSCRVRLCCLYVYGFRDDHSVLGNQLGDWSLGEANSPFSPKSLVARGSLSKGGNL